MRRELCLESFVLRNGARCVADKGHEGNHVMRQAKCEALTLRGPRYWTADLPCGQKARFSLDGKILCGTHTNQLERARLRVR
jgi:hypothetical protein